MCNDNRNWLLCLNSQLQPRGEALTKQSVQSSSIAWRALHGADPCLCKSRRPQYSAERALSQQHQHSSWKTLWEAHLYLPALLLSSCLDLVEALPRRATPCSCATQCGGFKTCNGQLPKGQNQAPENEEMKTIEDSFEIIGLSGWWPFVRQEASQAHSCVTEVGQAWKC